MLQNCETKKFFKNFVMENYDMGIMTMMGYWVAIVILQRKICIVR